MRAHRVRSRRSAIVNTALRPAGKPLSDIAQKEEFIRQWQAEKMLTEAVSVYRLMFGSRALLKVLEIGAENERRMVEILDRRERKQMPERANG